MRNRDNHVRSGNWIGTENAPAAGIDAAVTIQHMRTVPSHNAKAGYLTLIRLTRSFDASAQRRERVGYVRHFSPR